MEMDLSLQPSPRMDRSGSFLQLVDVFALSLGTLEQQMVYAAQEEDPDRDPGTSMIVQIEGEMSTVCLHYPADDSDSTSRVSVLDKLIHTHPIWLLLSIDQQEATGILKQQPAGVFLMWRSSVLQKKVLSFHMDDTSDSVIHMPVKESQYTFSLEGSGVSFADLFHLVAFYCISRDILPSTLKLPEAIDSAETLSDLHEVAQHGAAFWESSLNQQEGTLSPSDRSLVWDRQTSSLHGNCSDVSPTETQTCTPNGKQNVPLTLTDCCLHVSEGERSCSSRPLSFINPTFPKQDLNRHATTVTEKDLAAENRKFCRSPPQRPPPPCILVHSPAVPPGPRTMPLTAGSQRPKSVSGSQSTFKKTASEPPPRPPQQPDIDSYRCTIALDDDTISRALSQANQNHTATLLNTTSRTILQQWTGPEDKGCSSSGRSMSTSSSDSLDSPPDPLPLGLSQNVELSTDDTSDDYNEEEDYGVELERNLQLRLRASRKTKNLLAVELVGRRPRALVFPRALRHFRKVRGVLNVLATPEKRILQRIIELSQDKSSYFGCLVQDYVSFVQENKNCLSSSQDLLQTLRQFMTQMKAYLIQCSEINPPIQSYIPEDQIDPVLEKAMHKCVLKPLYGCLRGALHEFQVSGGVWQRLQENLALAKTKKPHELGANGARPPDAYAIHRIRRKLRAMSGMYSPERKIVVLLKVCKLIYNIMQDHEVRMFGADDFLPMLTYVLIQCDMPQLDTEILYMMELIDPPLLHGEGGYYLTSAYGAMSLIKNFQEEQAARLLRSTTRDTLHQWHQRRTLQRKLPSVDDFQNYMRVALQTADSGCTAKTLQVQPYATTEELCHLCALKFHVSDPENYGLFLFTDNSCQQLAADTYPQWIKAELHSRPDRQQFYFVYRAIPNMNCSS